MRWFRTTITVGMCLVAAVAVADDTAIYGTTSASVEPNVLIIFDTSGSMSTKDVPGEYYDPAQTYTGTKTSEAVYRKTCKNKKKCSYDVFASDVALLTCPAAKTALETNGHVWDDVQDAGGGFACGGSNKDLYMGNWLNYDAAGGGELRTRVDVAKEVITALINDTDGVRFGLMRFNSSEGGRIVENIGASKEDLISAVAALNTSDWTPLGETLAEAGLYYAGKESWFNGVTYTSPIQYRCQKNYIILMTDGQPTQDSNWRLATGNYINNDHIGDYDNDGNESGGAMDYLDDVAAYLFQNDLRSDLGSAGESFQRQNVITYTIGFQSEQTLLDETATNGGGQYYTANSISGLKEAFLEIIAAIADVNAVFVSPVVPVSRMNRTFAGNSLYVGFFKPQADGRWAGNIKKYGLGLYGELLDINGNEATLSDGTIKDNAQSYWSLQADGSDVMLGGIGGVLLEQGSRNLYTYLGSDSSLTDSTNGFTKTNTGLTAALLDVTDTTEKDAVVDDIYGSGKSWILGDILHSQPAVVHYDTDADSILDDAYIFAGGNDGIMHAFLDSDGSEQWGFIPPDQLSRLKLLSDSTTTHDYYMDGPPVVYEGATQKILFFGERRGGSNYYALDVTTPDAPVWLYQIAPGHLVGTDGDNDGTADGAAATLGQSWGNAVKGKIKTGASTSETVFLLGGGYDENQDNPTPAAADTVGRAVFTVDVTDGSVSSLNVNAGNNSAMTHSIVDVSGFDSNGNGYLNRAYAGDLGGNVWAFEDDSDVNGTSSSGDGLWTSRKLFSAGALDSVQRKIMYAPDTTLEIFGDMIFFGTGDRADPEENGVVNRIYAVKNEWTEAASFVTLTENDLVDVTDNLLYLGNETQRADTETALKNSKGWFIRLENLGEKVTASVTVYAGVVYFTTYTPETGVASTTDPCEAASGRGVARLYAVNYLTGAAAYDWSSDTETNVEGETVGAGKGKKDRSKMIGTSIPSAPVIAVLPGGARMYIGVEGGVSKQDPVSVADVNTYYWRQIF